MSGLPTSSLTPGYTQTFGGLGLGSTDILEICGDLISQADRDEILEKLLNYLEPLRLPDLRSKLLRTFTQIDAGPICDLDPNESYNRVV